MMRWLAIAVCCVGCGVAEPQDTLPPAPPTREALAGRIAFVSDRGGDQDVFVLSLADDTLTQKARPASQDFAAPASPDGSAITSIAVTGDDGDHLETLWWLDARTFVERPLAIEASKVRNPDWLPDGTAVVVEASRDGFRDLYRVPVDGSPAQRLTEDASGSFEPDVHPRGAEVAFSSSREGQSDIYSIDLATLAVRKLSWSRFVDMTPRWSPDGERLAYVSHRRGVPRIWSVNHDGAAPRAFTDVSSEAIEQSDPVWSPDGEALAFVERFPDRAAIRIVDRTGRTLARTTARAHERQPCWSPDGRWVAFVSDRDDDDELYALRRDGSDLRRLTRHAGSDALPRWLP